MRSVPRLLACLSVLSCFGGLPARAEGEWELVKLDGHEFVTAESVRSFYEFDPVRHETEGLLVFQKGGAIMEWKIGVPAILINQVKFNLSLPVREQDGDALISRVDLQKLLDPVLRPWFIADAELFDTVVIDAGHGGHDSGAMSRFQPEKFYALDLARRLKVEVEKRGFKTRMVREKDVYVGLFQRVKIANSVERSIFVSLHFNHGKKGHSSGVETFALAPRGMPSSDGTVTAKEYQGNRRDAENIALATAVHSIMVLQNQLYDRGIKRARFNVLRGIERPGILVEAGFLSHPGEAKRINSEAYRAKVARSIASGIENYHRAVLSASE